MGHAREDVRYGQGRGVRGKQATARHDAREIREEGALDLDPLGHRLDDEGAAAEPFHVGDGPDPVRHGRGPRPPSCGPMPRAGRAPRAGGPRRPSRAASLTSVARTAWPAAAKTCAIPRPMVPSPTTPIASRPSMRPAMTAPRDKAILAPGISSLKHPRAGGTFKASSCGRGDEDPDPRRRARGPLLRDLDEAARRVPRHHHPRAQPPRRHLRLGASCCRRRRWPTSPPTIPSPRRRSGATSPGGTTWRWSTAACAPYRRATGSAASGASSSSSTSRAARGTSASTCGSRPRRGLPRATWTTTTSWWRRTASTPASGQEFADALRARGGDAAQPLRLAGHQGQVRRRLHLHLREDRAWLGLGPRLPVRRGHRDLHRGMFAGDL